MTDCKRVLIADDDEDLVEVLARRCQGLGLAVERAHEGMTALSIIDMRDPDLVILDVNMPGNSGLRICEMTGRDPLVRAIPYIILTGRTDEETKRACSHLRAIYVHKSPDVWTRLEPLLVQTLHLQSPPAKPEGNSSAGRPVSAETMTASELAAARPPAPRGPANGPAAEIRTGGPQHPAGTKSDDSMNRFIDSVFAALGGSAPPPGSLAAAPASPWDEDPIGGSLPPSEPRPWILCIDDDGEFAQGLKLRLQQHGVNVVQAFAGMAGYRTAFTSEASAIILDYELPDGNGEYVLRRLKENPVTQDIPVIVLTGHQDKAVARKMLNLGAVRYFTKPVPWDQLWSELELHVGRSPVPA